MTIRRWIPHARKVTFVLTGFSAGLFVATGAAALAWGYVPPQEFRLTGTVIVYLGLLGIASLLLVDRRKRDRHAAPPDMAS
jgi:hypothetical protein